MEISSHLTNNFTDDIFQYNADSLESYITSIVKCVRESTIDSSRIDQLNQSLKQSGILSKMKSMPYTELIDLINIVACSISKNCPKEELPLIITTLRLLSSTLFTINVDKD